MVLMEEERRKWMLLTNWQRELVREEGSGVEGVYILLGTLGAQKNFADSLAKSI